MSTENNTENNNNEGSTKTEVSPEVQALIDAALAAQLAETKEKLDKAYGARDKAAADAEALRVALQQAEIEKLNKEGKAAEALQLQLEEERTKRLALEATNTALSRDNQVRQAIQDQSLAFMNGSALEMAFSKIVNTLTRNDKGEWVTMSGASINDAVKLFAGDENNAFLFKSKSNSGAGTPPNNNSGSSGSTVKSVFSMSQDEVIRLAKEGKLGNGGSPY